MLSLAVGADMTEGEGELVPFPFWAGVPMDGVPVAAIGVVFMEAGAVLFRSKGACSISTVMNRVFAGLSLCEAN